MDPIDDHADYLGEQREQQEEAFDEESYPEVDEDDEEVQVEVEEDDFNAHLEQALDLDG